MHDMSLTQHSRDRHTSQSEILINSRNSISSSHIETCHPDSNNCHPLVRRSDVRRDATSLLWQVWEAIRAGALAKVEKAGALAKFLIGLAVKMKAIANKQHRKTPLFNVLLKKFKATTGGNLKATLSGGGAISAEVQEWCRTALDCPLIQGYGLTETTGGATIQMPDDMSIGIAGTPLSSVEVVLHSELEITDAKNVPYLATDTIHSTGAPCAGRGEVWLRGINVSAGYYKMAELTASDFDADGWFHTGDIGMLTPGGAIQIIDRKKNLVKLKGGEYVALVLYVVVVLLLLLLLLPLLFLMRPRRPHVASSPNTAGTSPSSA